MRALRHKVEPEPAQPRYLLTEVGVGYRARGFLAPWHLMPHHIHMCVGIPPKYAVSNAVGYLKGKSAIAVAGRFGGRTKNFTGEVFWARGYYVSTVGLDEAMVRAYIRNQEETSSIP